MDNCIKYKIKENKTVIIRNDIVPPTTRTFYTLRIRTMDIVTGLCREHKFTISDNLYHCMNATDDFELFKNKLCNDRERCLGTEIVDKDLSLPVITLEMKYTWIL